MELNFNVLPRVIVEDEIRPCVGMTSNFFLSAADIRPFADRVATAVDALPFQVVFSASLTKRWFASCVMFEAETGPSKFPPPAYERAFQAVAPSPILCLRVSDS